MSTANSLVNDVRALLESAPDVGDVLGLATGSADSFASLAGDLLDGMCGGNTAIGKIVKRVYDTNASLIEQSVYDITETARRNFEPGGRAATLLFARGVHATMAHRVAHQLWVDGDHNLALAVKSTSGRAFATDIHPAAQIAAGLWLDHGLGIVIGETCVIEEDVSIWHSVTLGGTLRDSGPTRHPRLGRGVVVGAGAILLGNISVGAGANVGAGAVVVEDVPPATVVVGPKARNVGAAKVDFAPKKNRTG
ncbi:serine O-acetyltransferase [Litoreibacter janthinus]|uniref:serine O-acetyltransferase n=1 Tax=Litoreibacter janthinus TaxID=670154 RepID=A0A1I6G502_9RHOB|nr:serine acetyltransferase [Litoreibacter janthinus]SFR37200.1 serine O-acetyltransferase [Litoreibacter janthinus]